QQVFGIGDGRHDVRAFQLGAAGRDDDLVGRRPDGRIVDGRVDAALGVQLLQESAPLVHFLRACTGPQERHAGAVVGRGDGDQVLDQVEATQFLHVVAADQPAHAVPDQVDLASVGLGQDLVDAPLDDEGLALDV